MSQTPSSKQFTFAGGELSPELVGRTDLDRYQQSAQLIRNFIVLPTGVLKNRPGLELAREVKTSADRVRLLPFVFNNDQAYVMELGDEYMRLYQDGGLIVKEEIDVEDGSHDGGDDAATLSDSTATWTPDEWIGGVVRNLTDGSEGDITDNDATTITATLSGGTDNDWDTGDIYEITMQSGNHSGSNDVATLTDTQKGSVWTNDEFIGGVVYNLTDGSSGAITDNTTTTVTAVLSGGLQNRWDTGDDYTIKMPYEVTTYWDKDDLSELKYAQYNDLMFMTHQSYAPQELKRLDVADWLLADYTIDRPVNPPTSVGLDSEGTTGGIMGEWQWVVTTVDANGNESLPSEAFTDADVRLSGDDADTQISWTAPSGGNTPVSYNVYRGRNGVWGYVGSSKDVEFGDKGRTPDYADGPPTGTDPFEETITASEAGAPRSISFGTPSASEATKVTAAEAFDDNYTFGYHLYLAPSASVTLQFQADNDGGGYDTYKTKVFTTGKGEIIEGSFYQVINVDGMGASEKFKLNVSSSSGYYELTRNYVSWTEGSSEYDDLSYPAAVCFFEQRLVFGGFRLAPNTVKATRTGDLYNWDKSEPLKDDDTLTLTLAARRLDAIRDLVPIGSLMTLTAGALWVVRGADGGPLTPTSFDLKPRVQRGCSRVAALEAADGVLFLDPTNRVIREYRYDPESGAGKERELTLLVEHLFRDYTVDEWQYADIPYQQIWAVRSDGMGLSMCHVPDQNVWAWARHTTGPETTNDAGETVGRDEIESVCVIPEGGEDRIYMAVKRTINGQTKRFVERMALRRHTEDEDHVFMDSALTYDGRNPASATMKATKFTGTHTGGTHATVLTDSAASWATNSLVGMTINNITDGSSGTVVSNTSDTATLDDLTGGTDDQWENGDSYDITPTWAATEPMILDAGSDNPFSSTDVGREFALRSGTTEVRFRVTAYLNDSEVVVYAVTAVPAALQDTDTSDWGRAINTVSGLDHLEGETVTILVDGATHETEVVSSGSITLDANVYGERIHVGLGYNSDMFSLPLDAQGGSGTLRAAKKNISEIHLEVDSQVGLQAGISLDSLRDVAERAVADKYATVSAESNLVTVRPRRKWGRVANVAVRQPDPLPVTLLAIIMAMEVGGSQ